MEILCPTCGRMNPEDNEVCAACSAPLHPGPQVGPQIEKTPETGTSEPEEESSALPAEELPEWLRSLYSKEIASGSEEALAAFNPSAAPKRDDLNQFPDEAKDLPAWLGGIKQESPPLYQPAETTMGDQEKGSEIISASEKIESPEEAIPSVDRIGWTESPEKDLVTPSERRGGEGQLRKPNIEGGIEKTGILAGLTNALSAEPGVTQSRKSITQPSAIKATANQRAHADLLKTMVDTEGKASEIQVTKPSSSNRFIRWLVALLVLIGIGWMVYQNNQELGLPLYLEETSEISRLVNQLPPNSRVLIGFDYSPGLSAELEAAAQPVIDHILRRRARLTLVSTSTTGPLLAERFMGSIQSVMEPTDKTYYVNLGVIPGGALGLQSFVHDLQGTAPLTLDGSYAWGSGGQPVSEALQGIGELSDYDMILVLVDDADVARAWVEQIKPNLNIEEALTSLVMVSSAQVEPLIRPYFEGNPRQLDGLVVGLRGGAAYANITNEQGLPRLYWDIYGLGLFLAAMVLLLGSLAYSVIPSLTQPSPSKEAEV